MMTAAALNTEAAALREAGAGAGGARMEPADLARLRRDALIRIVDDDGLVREALSFMLACKGWQTAAYESAAAFLRDYSSAPPGCLLLDIRMPGMTGVELQERMKAERMALPVIFITGHADVPTAVLALKRGAFDFLEKPVDGAALEAAIEEACRVSAAEAAGRLSPAETRAVVEAMSPREREVLALLAAGSSSNRDMAERLGLSERTVQGHRLHVYQKLRVHSLKQLAEQLESTGWLEEMAEQGKALGKAGAGAGSGGAT